ncbi:MAG: outer membrane beta-barrel protein [Thiobacillaceae bacterium]
MNKQLSLLVAVLAGFPIVTQADEAPATPAAAAPAAAPAAPTLGAVLGASNISLTGYVDATYTYFDKGVPGGGSYEPERQFDYRKNSFVLNQAAITASYLPASGFGGLVNLIAGSDGKVLRNSEITDGGSTDSQFDLYQAYGQYATGPITLMAGKFATLAGAETVNPTTDTVISRSLLFYNLEPLSHTGVRASYAASMVTLTAGVNNGWNYTSAPMDTNTGKTINSKTVELGISASPTKMFSISGAIYTGDAPLAGVPSGSGHGRKDLYDLVATINATDALSFVINGDYVTQDDFTATGGSVSAYGIAGYVNYAINPEWSVTLRGEYLDDKDGALTGNYPNSNKLKEGTLALNYTPAKNVILKGEYRHDTSDVALFDTNGTSKSQNSVELEAIYKF